MNFNLYQRHWKSAEISQDSNREMNKSHIHLLIRPLPQNVRILTLTVRAFEMKLTELQQKIHQQNIDAGWWDNPRDRGTLLCLIHSEISEALEGERKNLMDDHLPHRPMAEVELADAVIRILDYAEAFGYDIESAIAEKLEYNRHRADHKRENRTKTGGKAF